MAKLIYFESEIKYEGEKTFSRALESYLDDSYVIYHNREVNGLEFDFCILVPNKGIIIVEVKGWHETDNIVVRNDGQICIITDEGQIIADPKRQARNCRFALLNYIERKTGKRPTVLHMVAYPFITEKFYNDHKMNINAENYQTFLQDDIGQIDRFIQKIENIFTIYSLVPGASFGDELLFKVRSLFEPDITFTQKESTPVYDNSFVKYDSLYSCLQILTNNSEDWQHTADSLIYQYFKGTKIFLFCNSEEIHKYVFERLFKEFARRNINPESNNISITTPDKIQMKYGKQINLFNWHSEIVDIMDTSITNLCIKNGTNLQKYEEQLKDLSNKTSFNLDQYMIEHTVRQKNVLVKAGAGTGKTYAMVQRIAYLIAANNMIPEEICNRFILITFTNDAANNMKDRLRLYFSNCYVLTGNSLYLRIVQNIDSMMISTIHSFSKRIIDLNCDALGYGASASITSTKNSQWKKCLDTALEKYIKEKKKQDRLFISQLGLQIYEIQEILSDFDDKLGNKNIDILKVSKEKFGENHTNPLLHELIYDVLQDARREYTAKLYENDQLMLSDMILQANEILMNQEHQLKMNGFNKNGYLFVDEFQDTDDVQIDFIKRFVSITGCRLFVVGDLKQCIYRFRGAEEKAFDHLGIDDKTWTECTLKKNYRTDMHLLSLFEKSFEKWGNPRYNLLPYSQVNDKLTSDLNINGNLEKDQYYRRLTASDDSGRFSQTKDAILYFEQLINDRIQTNQNLSINDRTIAILVRKNWQAQAITQFLRTEGYRTIETITDGNLFTSQPAIDLLVLINALLYPTPQHLGRLLATSFFDLGLPKIELSQRRPGTGSNNTDNNKQIEFMTDLIDKAITQKNGSRFFTSWEHVQKEFRLNPALQVLKQLYSQFEPWLIYGNGNDYATQFYKINADLILEAITQKYGVTGVSLLTIHNYLESAIHGGSDLDCRYPVVEENKIRYVCSTVHKAKGLEFGFVIMPYCNEPIDRIRKLGTLVVEDPSGKIGYSITTSQHPVIRNSNFDPRIENRLQSNEETRILYVAMTRAISGFAWIDTQDYQNLSWQKLLEGRALWQ